MGANIPTPSINILSHTPPPQKAPGQKFEGAENVPTVVAALRNDANVI
jgi:hypothetical protein